MSRLRIERFREVLARRQPDLTVLLEQVHKPHNLAAVLRTCDAVGVLEAHAVTAARPSARLHHPSAGASKWVKVSFHEEIGAAIRELQSRGFQVLAAHPEDGARPFREVDFCRPTALLLGQEKLGVTAEALACCDGKVMIPMMGLAGSLNVSVAAALLLYEAERQRREAGLYDQPRLEPGLSERLLFEWTYPELAAYCQTKGVAYPRLSPDGELIDPVPR
ncbi:MAG: tRNA (guanosine(18)-2'-O)-methyltransferase TrmH [Thermoanaerobaculia bacterium]